MLPHWHNEYLEVRLENVQAEELVVAIYSGIEYCQSPSIADIAALAGNVADDNTTGSRQLACAAGSLESEVYGLQTVAGPA